MRAVTSTPTIRDRGEEGAPRERCSASLRGCGPAFRRGLGHGFPIAVGYLTSGFAYGIAAAQANLTPWEALAMSLLVFAGSAQFAAVGILAQGGAAAALVATTALLNLRHLFFSAVLARRLAKHPPPALALAAFGLTDEVFAAAQASLPRDRPLPFLYGMELVTYFAWCAASWLGASYGDGLRGSWVGVLDYVLPAMLLTLLVIQLGQRRLAGLLSAGAAALVTTILANRGGVAGVQVLVAAVVGSTAGMGVEWCVRKWWSPSS